MKKTILSLCMVCLVPLAAGLAYGDPASIGIFSDQTDIGAPAKPGAAAYDPARGEYLVTGGGGNMWGTNDSFHFVWKKMSGDLSLTANIQLIGIGGAEHRKACLLIRQNLDANSPYVDVALHGNGLTCIQYRETTNSLTREIISNVSGPTRLSVEKHGDYATMSFAGTNEELHAAGGTFKIHFKEPFYVGLGVCAHDNSTMQRALFSKVKIEALPAISTSAPQVASTLEVVTIASTDRRVVYHTQDHIEAPNWSPNDDYFLFNRSGRIYKLPLIGGVPERVDTATCTHCNNDHGISPDGSMLAISDQSEPDNKSRIYVLPVTGGAPRQVTTEGPSYWHGWSPDGHTLAYCAERNGQFDIYTIPVDGGTETRLTSTPQLDDGPDYSPGGLIYFNSASSGHMQIYKMQPDGSNQEQVTHDDYNNWFPHPSPDGKWIVFLSYPADVTNHPANKDVMLRLMPVGGGEPRLLAKLLGGQGTINVPSWSPDSRQVAFMSYQYVYPETTIPK